MGDGSIGHHTFVRGKCKMEERGEKRRQCSNDVKKQGSEAYVAEA